VLGEDTAPTLEELQDHCRRAIAGYKIPRSLEFVEALPRTGIGKVRKSELRQPHWQDTERNIR
jgi:acyl-CoA synthetase (AMP-forming)/AMP-acid ligase II